MTFVIEIQDINISFNERYFDIKTAKVGANIIHLVYVTG
jgi:hypothetical protein